MRSEAPLGGEASTSGPGGRISLLDLVAAINAILGTRLEPEFQPARAGDVRDSQASLDRIRAALGYGRRSVSRRGCGGPSLPPRRHRPPRRPDDSMASPKVWAAAWTLALLAGCLAPGRVTRRWEPDRPRAGSLLDKAAHFAMFAGFGALWMRAGSGDRAAARVAALGAVLAVATEVLQGLPLIRRDPDILDVLADLAGLLIGVAVPPIGRHEPP